MDVVTLIMNYHESSHIYMFSNGSLQSWSFSWQSQSKKPGSFQQECSLAFVILSIVSFAATLERDANNAFKMSAH
jgi:hypothetical protein